jgi:hypothetical protein
MGDLWQCIVRSGQCYWSWVHGFRDPPYYPEFPEVFYFIVNLYLFLTHFVGG